MKILVCIKQVPDMESKFKLNPEGLWYSDANLAWRMNEYDEYAVEQAVQLKEQLGDAEICVLAIGPDRVKEMMKKALAMGADRGVHIKDEEPWRMDCFGIASLIAAYARDKDFGLVFTGMQSQDRGSAQVGTLVGEMLELPVLSTLVEFSFEGGRVSGKRELEGGVRARVSAQSPAVVTCQLGLNTPRYPTLPNIMKAKKKEIQTLVSSELGVQPGRVEMVRVAFPEKRKGGMLIQGDISQMTSQLMTVLKDKFSII